MPSSRRRATLLYGIALVLTLINLAPLIWIGLTAFKTRMEIYQLPPVWIPDFTYVENFRAVLSEYWPFLVNSIAITLCSTV
ncbi:MAG TPA: hypothetical protein VHL31_03160, partial [Geminicoccus sp.]|nr:hypothetical protein [Geminicoccus sp.]